MILCLRFALPFAWSVKMEKEQIVVVLREPEYPDEDMSQAFRDAVEELDRLRDEAEKK